MAIRLFICRCLTCLMHWSCWSQRPVASAVKSCVKLCRASTPLCSCHHGHLESLTVFFWGQGNKHCCLLVWGRSPDDHAVDAVEADSLYQRMPASLKAALLPFQQTGVKFGLTRRGRVLIADEMGVGKTVQALALASCYQVGEGNLLMQGHQQLVVYNWPSTPGLCPLRTPLCSYLNSRHEVAAVHVVESARKAARPSSPLCSTCPRRTSGLSWSWYQPLCALSGPRR